MEIRYPVYQPLLGEREKELVNDCLDSNWISSKGKYVSLFEEKFAEFVGVRHAISVSNGTVALHVALAALGIGPGDEVLVPSLTYIASSNAVAYTGATPVFVDSEAEFWQIDVDDAESKITDRTKAIMPVHLYGHPCSMDAISELAEKYSLSVIEDCAEALGSKYNNIHVGTFGDVGTFSFFGNKTITTGEGGMVVTNEDHLADAIRHLKGQGLAPDREYWHDVIGFNYRMTNICAAIGVAQLENVHDVLAKKRELSCWYNEVLADTDLLIQPEADNCHHSYWMISVLAGSEHSRDSLRQGLRDEGIETRPVFNPIHLMSLYDSPTSCLPHAEDLSKRGFSLPSYPELTRRDVELIGSVMKSILSSVTI